MTQTMLALLTCAAATAAPSLWTTDGTGRVYAALDPTSAKPTSSVSCKKGCGLASGSRGLATSTAGMIYTIRVSQGFFHHVELEAFSIRNQTATTIRLPALKTYGSGLAMGNWGVEYDASQRRVLVLGPMQAKPTASANRHALLAVYGNGTVAPIGAPIDDLREAPDGTGSTAFDEAAQVFYTVYTSSAVGTAGIRGLSARTGLTVFDLPAPGRFGVFTMDLVGGRLLCLGLDFTEGRQPQQYRTLLAVSGLPTGGLGALGSASGRAGGGGANASVTRLLNLTDYGMNMPTTAVDPSSGALNLVLIPQSSQSAALVTLDLANMTVASAPQLCATYYECPFLLQWA